MLPRLMRGFGYSAYFVVALVVCMYWSIPKDKVKSFVQRKATAALKTQVRVGGLEIRGISGITLTGVQITIPIQAKKIGPLGAGPATPDTPAKETQLESEKKETTGISNPPGLVNVERISVDLNTFGLLMGKPLKALVSAEISGGKIEEFTVRAGKKGWDIKLEGMEDINVAPTRLFAKLLKTDIHTFLSGQMNLDWRGSLKESTGRLELELSDTKIPYLEIKDKRLPIPIEIFELDAGKVNLKAVLDKKGNITGLGGRQGKGPTVLSFEKLTARGESIEIQLDGGQKHTLTFNGPTLATAMLDIKIVVYFTDAFFKWKGDGVRSDGTVVKDMNNELLKMGLVGAQSQLRRARIRLGKKYYFGFRCRGPLKTFRCTQSAPSRRVAPRIGVTPKPTAQKGSSPKLSRPTVPKRRSVRKSKPRPARAKPKKSGRTTQPKLYEPAAKKLTNLRSPTFKPPKKKRGSHERDMDAPPPNPVDPAPTVGEKEKRADDDDDDDDDDDEDDDDDDEDDDEDDDDDDEDDEDDD